MVSRLSVTFAGASPADSASCLTTCETASRTTGGMTGRATGGTTSRKTDGTTGRKTDGTTGRKTNGTTGRKTDDTAGRKTNGTTGVTAVKDVSLTFPGNRITGIIGESGSGKSVLGMSLIGLLPEGTEIGGKITLGGEEISRLTQKGMRRLRQKSIALVPQDPFASLNPVMRIREQIGEALGRKKGRYEEVEGFLSQLSLSGKGGQYPFRLSGGMRQRALVAMGLIRKPSWLLADEPTKGLDARLRHRVFELLGSVHERTRAGIILISHDLPFARRLCHRIAVLYCGRIVETGPAESLFTAPLHPYTRALLQALPGNGFTPVPGPVPHMPRPPSGCPFHPRCSGAMPICREEFPRVRRPAPEREVYCHAEG